MVEFVKGLELNRRFYIEIIRPLLAQHFANISYAAALIGTGSDVLGFDTEMSTDHDWGLGLLLFLKDAENELIAKIDEMLNQNLPTTFYGYAVHFREVADEPDTLVMQPGGTRHRVRVDKVADFMQRHFDYDVKKPLEVVDWLTFSSQKLRGLTAGAVYHEGGGELTALREQFAYYPHELWLYLLAAGWQRIGQEEHLMSRAGYVGDELGSALIGSRLVRDIMSLCFLMEKKYAPYPKWFGTAFKQLDCALALEPILMQAQIAQSWQKRAQALGEAYQYIARSHNKLGLTTPLPETVSNFHNRPFKVIQGENFAKALSDQITDPQVKRIAAKGLIGSVDQFSDSTDLRSHLVWREGLRGLYPT